MKKRLLNRPPGPPLSLFRVSQSLPLRFLRPPPHTYSLSAHRGRPYMPDGVESLVVSRVSSKRSAAGGTGLQPKSGGGEGMIILLPLVVNVNNTDASLPQKRGLFLSLSNNPSYSGHVCVSSVYCAFFEIRPIIAKLLGPRALTPRHRVTALLPSAKLYHRCAH